MKINWGTGIVLAFIGFIGFILFLVITMSTNKKYNHDLVTEDYYKQELEYQNEINKLKNAKKLTKNISWEKTTSGLLITFPENCVAKNITGNVQLYRPSNKALDFETNIVLSSHELLIPESKLLEGRWNIKIDWQYDKISYMFKEDIIY